MSPPVSARITWATFTPPGNGLQQLDLVRPRPAGLGDHRIQRRQIGLDRVQPAEDAAGQLGVAGVEAVAEKRAYAAPKGTRDRRCTLRCVGTVQATEPG